MQPQARDWPALAPSKHHKIRDKRKMQRQSEEEEEEDDVRKGHTTANHTHMELPKTKL